MVRRNPRNNHNKRKTFKNQNHKFLSLKFLCFRIPHFVSIFLYCCNFRCVFEFLSTFSLKYPSIHADRSFSYPKSKHHFRGLLHPQKVSLPKKWHLGKIVFGFMGRRCIEKFPPAWVDLVHNSSFVRCGRRNTVVCYGQLMKQW